MILQWNTTRLEVLGLKHTKFLSHYKLTFNYTKDNKAIWLNFMLVCVKMHQFTCDQSYYFLCVRPLSVELLHL